MNRKIKFRAWCNLTNSFVEDFEKNYLIEVLNIDLFVINQFTGLKDELQNDIYEGDIILFTENSKKHIVKYIEGGFRLTATNGNIIVYNINPKQIYVIGNIFENNDLLTI